MDPQRASRAYRAFVPPSHFSLLTSCHASRPGGPRQRRDHFELHGPGRGSADRRCRRQRRGARQGRGDHRRFSGRAPARSRGGHSAGLARRLRHAHHVQGRDHPESARERLSRRDLRQRRVGAHRRGLRRLGQLPPAPRLDAAGRGRCRLAVAARERRERVARRATARGSASRTRATSPSGGCAAATARTGSFSTG